MGMHGCSWHVLEAQAKCVYDPVHNALPRLYPMWPDVHESIMTLRVSHEGPSWPSIQAPALLDTKHPGDQQQQVEDANVRSAVMASSQ
jgi:hypothetical protein